MRRFAIAALAVAFPVFMSACDNGSNSVEPTVSIAGTYTLRTINGTSLPFTFSDGSTMTSEVLTLFSDGTYSDTEQFSDGSLAVEQGFYDALNGSITFTVSPSGQAYGGSLSGSVLTEIFPNFTLVYQKTD